jgi:hypothetical protein
VPALGSADSPQADRGGVEGQAAQGSGGSLNGTDLIGSVAVQLSQPGRDVVGQVDLRHRVVEEGLVVGDC